MDHGIMFGQVTCLLGGLFLLLVGISLLFTLFYWRTRALTAEGEIIGVRQAGRYFHTVYRFTLPGGEVREATSGQGSTNLQGRSTGRRVPILVMPDRPDEIRESGSATPLVLSIGSLAAGVWMIWFALTAWPATFLTWIVAGGVVIYGVTHAARVLRSRKDLVAQGRAKGEARWSAAPIRQAQELGASSHPQIVSAKQRRTGVIFCLAGLAIIATAYIPAQQLRALRTGTHAIGVVTRLEANTGNNRDPNLFPRVQFTGADGSIIRFVDRAGSNPAPFKVGDQVTVLYQPEDPSSTAMIDRGARNWVPVGMLLLLGAAFAVMGLSSLRGK
jgi:hypothetical protein